MHRIFEENYAMLLSEMLLGRMDMTGYAWIAADLTEFTDNETIEKRVHVEVFAYKVLPGLQEDFTHDEITVWWETPKSEHWDILYDWDITVEQAKEYNKDRKNMIISIEKFTDTTS